MSGLEVRESKRLGGERESKRLGGERERVNGLELRLKRLGAEAQTAWS